MYINGPDCLQRRGKENAMENLEIRIAPERVLFRRSLMIITESETRKYRIPYKEIVYTYIRIWDDKEEQYLTPEIADITRKMEGEWIFHDRENWKWTILTHRLEERAGLLFKELCVHAPYVMAGGQDWFDSWEEQDMEEVGKMVELMRKCGFV